MDQSEIFRLLLIVLLLANRQLSEDEDASDTTNGDFSYTMINDLLILTMALNGFGDDDGNKNTTF